MPEVIPGISSKHFAHKTILDIDSSRGSLARIVAKSASFRATAGDHPTIGTQGETASAPVGFPIANTKRSLPAPFVSSQQTKPHNNDAKTPSR